MLSSRGEKNADTFDIPWRYAVAPTYNKETNPEGVISLGLAEHVRTLTCLRGKFILKSNDDSGPSTH
jgi:hypothetical protein